MLKVELLTIFITSLSYTRTKMGKKQKENDIFQPDDRFFGQVMSQVENARAYLEDFYPEVAEMADLTTLEIVTDRFIRSNLKIFRSDIIYRCKFKNKKEHFYFSLIWEHKLEPEEEVAIQVGLYIFLFLYRLSKAKDRVLEPVLPLIFYNGKKDWTPKTVHQLFEGKPYFDFFKQFLPDFSFLFKNITKMPTEELLALESRFFRSAMMSMAFRHKVDLIINNISIIFEVDDKDQLIAIVHYVSAIIDRSPKKFREIIENIDFPTKSEVMSTLAMIKEEGKIEGIIEGITFKEIENLLTILTLFPDMDVDKVSQISKVKPSVIKRLKVLIKTKKSQSIRAFINKNFLAKITLAEKQQKEIDLLIKKLLV